MGTQSSALRMALLLAGGMCLLPFLLPDHQQPFLSFYPEWLAVALGVAAALSSLFRRTPVGTLPAAARWLIVFALFLALRTAWGGGDYPQVSLLATLYVLYATLMIWLGAELAAAFGIERVATVLAALLLAGALANAAAGAIQFYGRPVLFEDFIAELHGPRAYGNIAQANLYADYLSLGEGALLFLWLRRGVRTGFALTGLALLVVGSALSGSRSVALYALWYASLAFFAGRSRHPAGSGRLKLGAGVLAGTALTAFFVVPWINGMLETGPRFIRLAASAGQLEPHAGAFLLGLRAFASAPLFGTGMGGFAGAAYQSGIDPSLTIPGEVWTSPHNLVLHLLAETGLTGTLLVLVALTTWGLRLARRYREDPQPALWWMAAAAGVVLIHSAIEFPLWSADYLGVTALLIGASSVSGAGTVLHARITRAGIAALCAALTLALGFLLRDYLLLDLTRITGTMATLTPAPQARQDAATVRELAHGLMAPLAERWIVLGAPLDRRGLADKLAMSGRVARNWPASTIVARHAVFLAFAGRVDEARTVLDRALRTFPMQRQAIQLTLQQALRADPAAIGPLLSLAQHRSPS